MDDWKPREHDHLIEPVFGGLGSHRPAAARRSRALLAAVIVVVAAIALRVATLV